MAGAGLLHGDSRRCEISRSGALHLSLPRPPGTAGRLYVRGDELDCVLSMDGRLRTYTTVEGIGSRTLMKLKYRINDAERAAWRHSEPIAALARLSKYEIGHLIIITLLI